MYIFLQVLNPRYQESPHQPQQLQYLAATPPSTTPSPGQPHQQVNNKNYNPIIIICIHELFCSSKQWTIQIRQKLNSWISQNRLINIISFLLILFLAIPPRSSTSRYYTICTSSTTTISSDTGDEWSSRCYTLHATTKFRPISVNATTSTTMNTLPLCWLRI